MTDFAGQRMNHRLSRLIKLRGGLSKDVAVLLALEAKALLEQSHDPITLVINSGGGEVDALVEFEPFLIPQGNAGSNIKIITIARYASSAAACLLVAGHLAYAEKCARIFFHGTRTTQSDGLTILRRENALALAMKLDRQNRKIARIMAQRVVARMVARYLALELPINCWRHRSETWSLMRNFADAVRPRLSSVKVEKMLYESLDRLKLILAVDRFYPSGTRRVKKTDFAPLESKLYKTLMDNEIESHLSPEWSLGPTTAAELMMDYLLARDHIRGDHLAVVHDLARTVGARFLTKVKTKEYEKLKRNNAARADAYLLKQAMPCLLGFWYFASTLCHRLLSGENALTATDAYWLGLVDEILDGQNRSG